MDQNKTDYQNGQVNYPEINDTPDNPYTGYYQEYIVNPNVKKNRLPRSKRIAQRILCAVSNMVTVTFCVMWTAIAYQLLSGYRNEELTVSSFTALTLMLSAYLLITAIVLAIVAKILNPKSTWAVINIISIAIIFAAALIAGLFLPGKDEDNRLERNVTISGALNSDIGDLMEEYSFDVQDFDGNYKYRKDKDYDIWIYVSSEASESQIRKLDDLLEDLYSMDSSREYRIRFTVHPVCFEPDDNSSFVFLDTYYFEYEKSFDNPEWADIDEHLYVNKYSQRETSHVPEALEKGDMLIVIR